jgi:enoyl-CoA hydratase
MDYERIRFEIEDQVALITIDRPDKLNAIDTQTSRELLDAFSTFRDSDDAAVAILTGAGERAFSSGNDLVAATEALAAGTAPAEVLTGMPPGGTPFAGITRGFECPKPIIAAINGYCLAGGLELALCCDIRICSANAQFGQPEPAVGLIPGAGGTQRLPRIVPAAVANYMLLTGARIDAETALRAGLVSEVLPQADLLPRARELAEQIRGLSPLAVRAIKRVADAGLELSLEDGLALEDQVARVVAASEDAREGPAAFAEKRKPQFKGR